MVLFIKSELLASEPSFTVLLQSVINAYN